MSETIAIDIDDTLVDTAPAIINHYHEAYGIQVPLEHFYSRDLSVWGVEDYALATERVGAYLHSPEFDLLVPYPEAQLSLRALSRDYRLVAVTGRPASMERSTMAWLDQHFPESFSDLRLTSHFTKDYVSKGEVCDQLRADWLIDDFVEHLHSLGAYGIRGVAFGNRPWARGQVLPRYCYAAEDWPGVESLLQSHR